MDESITDILINGHECIFIDKGLGLEKTKLKFKSEELLKIFAQKIAFARGKRLDQSQPYVDTKLTKNIRFHCILSPLSSPGTLISLRIHKNKTFKLDDLEKLETITRQQKTFLKQIIDNEKSFVICGGTGSGKTTLLNTLISEIDTNSRIIVIEDLQEIITNHPHLISLEARQANIEGVGEITMRDLVKQTLRMRADRLIIGEVRGIEVMDWLAALNTGHKGGAGTIHANSIYEVISRFESLGFSAGCSRELIHSQISTALQYVIHVEKTKQGIRKIVEIGEFVKENDQIEIKRIDV